MEDASQGKLIAAFLAVYVIWGSTYLAIRVAVETLPPFLMAGSRFVVSGALMYLWAQSRGMGRPKPVHWRATFVVGALLLLGGNGGVVWAEQRVPSGLAALMVTMTPLWMTLLEWLRPGGVKPGAPVVAGLTGGFVGVALLVGPGKSGGGHVGWIGAVSLLIATLAWACGSLYSRHATLPKSPVLATGMEMLLGGFLLLLAGTVTGEWSRIVWHSISLQSLLAFLYLIVFGSFLGFSSYIYLLNHTTVARASTYAYVNPIVAVVLGWAVLHETITPRTMLAAAIIVGAVILITAYKPARTSPAPEFPDPLGKS